MDVGTDGSWVLGQTILQDRGKTFICDTVTGKSRNRRHQMLWFPVPAFRTTQSTWSFFCCFLCHNTPPVHQIPSYPEAGSRQARTTAVCKTLLITSRPIIHQFRGEALCSPVLLPKDHHSESCSCISSSCPNSSFKRQIRRKSVTHQNGKCAWFPTSLLEMLPSSISYFDGINIF